jgi:hypothetical protein
VGSPFNWILHLLLLDIYDSHLFCLEDRKFDSLKYLSNTSLYLYGFRSGTGIPCLRLSRLYFSSPMPWIWQYSNGKTMINEDKSKQLKDIYATGSLSKN